MGAITVLAEHRGGRLRDITFEMLSGAGALAEGIGEELWAVLLEGETSGMAEELKGWADRVLVVRDPRLSEFNSETYQVALIPLLQERKPSLFLIGHTSFGMELAPRLAAELSLPLITDCLSLTWDGGLRAIRQFYGGKISAEIRAKEAPTYMVTVRSGAFEAEQRGRKGEVEEVPPPSFPEEAAKRFLRYIEAAVGEVDISQAEVIVAVGRGIGEAENISVAEELAKALGGVLACSRPIVDKKWLPKERQVGTSGKQVKPKVYIALGISGAFQHVAGIKGGTIIAVNKDPRAPIFNVADYGIVEDLFKVVPILKEKIKALKS